MDVVGFNGLIAHIVNKEQIMNDIKKLQAQVDEFNNRCPIGGLVYVTLDSGEVKQTTTKSEAQILSGHSSVVWLNGVRGCYDLDKVQPL